MRCAPAHLLSIPFRATRLLLIICLGFAPASCSIQTSLIFPGAATQGRLDTIVHPRPGEELVHLTAADGTRITSLFGTALTIDGNPRPDSSQCPTILFFYGNGSCMAFTRDEFDGFRRLGANVIVPDYEGYGMSDGNPSESHCNATADAAYAWLLANPQIASSRIVAAGWSLGSGVAIDLASRKPVAGLMTFSAYTSMDDMGRQLVPWFPQSLFLTQHFDSLKKIKNITCPALIVHGEKDHFIPPSMSACLAAAAKSPVTSIVVLNAHHNDLFEVGGVSLYASIGKFLDALR